MLAPHSTNKNKTFKYDYDVCFIMNIHKKDSKSGEGFDYNVNVIFVKFSYLNKNKINKCTG